MPKIVENEFCKNVIVTLPEHLYNYLTEVCKEHDISRNRYIRNWIEFEYQIDLETKNTGKKGE